MNLIINGLVFATFETVKEKIIIDLNDNVELTIKNNGEFSIVTIGNKTYYLETSSLKYELVTP